VVLAPLENRHWIPLVSACRFSISLSALTGPSLWIAMYDSCGDPVGSEFGRNDFLKMTGEAN
jgi:hypothetical protein